MSRTARTSLPALSRLKRITLSLATLDIIQGWGVRDGVFFLEARAEPPLQCFRVDMGSGDTLTALFLKSGAVVWGFAHESPMSPYAHDEEQLWPGLLDELPADMLSAYEAAREDPLAITCCFWSHDDNGWREGDVRLPKGDDPDGREHLTSLIPISATEYGEFASSYYSRPMDIDAIQAVYDHGRLDAELVVRIEPKIRPSYIKEVLRKVGALGYPV
jgi:hypothetical protein